MWDYLTYRPNEDEIFEPLAVAYLVVFLLGFLVAVFLYNDGGSRLTTNPILRRYLRRAGGYLLIPFSLGLFFFAFRILQIDPFTFGRRIWLYLSALAAAATAAYLAYQFRSSYQAEVESYRRDRVKRQYIKPTGVPAAPKNARRGRR